MTGLLSVALWGCGGPKHPPPTAVPLPAAPASLTPHVDALKAAFNAAADQPRVLVLLSTT